MSILTLAVYVQNLLVVSYKPEQLIWVNKKWSLVHRPPENPAVINRLTDLYGCRTDFSYAGGAKNCSKMKCCWT